MTAVDLLTQHGIEVPEKVTVFLSTLRSYPVPSSGAHVGLVTFSEADAAIDALIRECVKWKWVFEAVVAEHCFEGPRSPAGVDKCAYCQAEIKMFLARYEQEAER